MIRKILAWVAIVSLLGVLGGSLIWLISEIAGSYWWLFWVIVSCLFMIIIIAIVEWAIKVITGW